MAGVNRYDIDAETQAEEEDVEEAEEAQAGQYQPAAPTVVSPPQEPEPQPDRDSVLQEMEQQLQKALGEIQKHQASVDDLKKQVAALQADYKELKASDQEIDKAVDEYGKAAAALQSRLSDLKGYAGAKEKMLRGLLSKEELGKVETVRSSADQSIADLGKLVAGLSTEYQPQLPDPPPDPLPAHAAALKLKWAQDKLRQEQASYDDLKKRKANLEAALKAAEDVKKPLEAADDASNYKLAYYYLLELKSRLEALQVDEAQDFAANLDKAWKAVVDDKKAARQAETQNETAKAMLDAKGKELADAQKNREQLILAGLNVP
jgi:FtsZ-binding cell division protein ZapB